MHLKCSNGHEYFDDFITLLANFLSNSISGYSCFNLHCKMHYGLCTIAGNNFRNYPGKGGKHWRSICCLLNRPAQKTDSCGSCPWRLVACLINNYTQLLLKYISPPHYVNGNRGGQFQMEIPLTDFPEEVPISFVVCRDSLW